MKKHATCTNCKALDRLEWTCKLGHKIIAGKRFEPRNECPKPLTGEEYSAVVQHYPKVRRSTFPCYQCGKEVNYIFDDGRGACCTRLTIDGSDWRGLLR